LSDCCEQQSVTLFSVTVALIPLQVNALLYFEGASRSEPDWGKREPLVRRSDEKETACSRVAWAIATAGSAGRRFADYSDLELIRTRTARERDVGGERGAGDRQLSDLGDALGNCGARVALADLEG